MQGQENYQSIYISMGSNCGDAEENLKKAQKALEAYPKTLMGARSSLYQTEPQGDKDQSWFYNQVIRLDFKEAHKAKNSQEASKNAHELLNFLLDVENKMGRVRDKNRRFGPRIIDLDIICFGNINIFSEKLTIPHPRFLERAFILIPLQEIASDIILSKANLQNIYSDFFLKNLFHKKKNISIEQALQALTYTRIENKIYQP